MRLLKTIDSISNWSGTIFSFLAVVVLGAITYEVIARHAFGSPTFWAHETMTLLSGVLYMIGGAYTLWVRGHVNVDVLYTRWSPRGRAIADLLTFPFFLVFCGVLLWTSASITWDSWIIRETSSTHWAPPLYPFRFMIPLGALLVILQGLAKFIRDINIVATGEEP